MLPRRLRPLLLAALVAAPFGCSPGQSGSEANPPPAQDAPAVDAPVGSPTPDPAEGSNFASPPSTDPAAPSDPPPPDDPALAARVREKFGEGCRLERVCGDMAGVDCNAAADGPYYYVRKGDLSTLSTCGGACMSGRCTECPPKGWTCKTY